MELREHELAVPIRLEDAEIGDDGLWAAAADAGRHALARPPRKPADVQKSTFSGKRRFWCGVMMNHRSAQAAISIAPPEPGSRTLGL